MQMEFDDRPIVVQQTFTAPISKVWAAITDVDLMRQWYFETIGDFVPEEGFHTRFTVCAGEQNFVHVWNVTDVVPEKRIRYDWRYDGYPGDSDVTWELVETSGGTLLTLTHRGIESFPKDNPMFSREAGQAGWNALINIRLKAFLERHT